MSGGQGATLREAPDLIDELTCFHKQHLPYRLAIPLCRPLMPTYETEDQNDNRRAAESDVRAGPCQASAGPPAGQLEMSHDNERDEDYYSDGVRRTLTDEEIQIFRHSEIQRLLAERRKGQGKQQKTKNKKETENKTAERK